MKTKLFPLATTLALALSASGCTDLDTEETVDEAFDAKADSAASRPHPSCEATLGAQPLPDPFLDSIPQDCYRLDSGVEAQLPFKFWGARSLLFVGTADLQQTRKILNPLGYEPLDLLGNGTAAVGFVATDYENSSAGPIKPIYMVYWTTGKLADPSCYDGNGIPTGDPTCVPGILFSRDYYANTPRAVSAGIDLWGIPKKLAMNEVSFLGDTKGARVLRNGKQLITLSWNRGAHPELVDADFQLAVWGQTPPEPHFASSNYLIYAGRQLRFPGTTDPIAGGLIPFSPQNGDVVSWDEHSALGKTLDRIGFDPNTDGGFWTYYSDYRGVLHDQVYSAAGPVLD